MRYSYDGFNSGNKLDLLSDGRFINENYLFSCMGGGEVKKVFGTYIKDNLKLTLNPESIEFMVYSEYSGLKPKTTKIKYGIDSLKIKTEFHVVKWENNEYLFSDSYDLDWSTDKENDYIRFAYNLNKGLEPKINGMYLVNKTKDSITSEFDLKQIPERWQSYFLKEPISVRVKSIKKIIDPNDEENIFWKIELDKGEIDRIYNRLTFETYDGVFLIEIDSVLSNKSFGMIYSYDFKPEKMPIGTELRTKWY
ncbi:hypothetical protein [Flavobacterium sp.]|uniref:hypothetical protein n=1 Tax=Flavobacterium sp. TaxID=239 RepID=UPI003F697B55